MTAHIVVAMANRESMKPTGEENWPKKSDGSLDLDSYVFCQKSIRILFDIRLFAELSVLKMF